MVQFNSAVAFALLGSSSIASAQSLLSALTSYSQTSVFQSLLQTVGGNLSSILPAEPLGYTLFVPSDAAFTQYSRDKGVSLSQIPPASLLNLLQYHAGVGKLTSKEFASTAGLTVPTLLKDEAFNNRSAGAELQQVYGNNANGQVLFISASPLGRAKFLIRQASPLQLRSGLGRITTMDAVDGVWDGGRFQVVDR